MFHLDAGRRAFDREADREAGAGAPAGAYLSPYLAEAHLLLGRIHLRGGRADEADPAFKIALWSEETVGDHVLLAEAYLPATECPGSQRRDRSRARARPDVGRGSEADVLKLGHGRRCLRSASDPARLMPMTTSTHDEGFHEIQLNGKQLVFLFMAGHRRRRRDFPLRRACRPRRSATPRRYSIR